MQVTNEVTGTVVDLLTDFWVDQAAPMCQNMFAWLYRNVFSCVYDLFSGIGNLGTGLFSLSWVQAFLQFFQLFGWAMFLSGLATTLFSIAVEYQTSGRISVSRQILPVGYGFLAVHLFVRLPVQLYRWSLTLQQLFLSDLSAAETTHSYETAAEEFINRLEDTVSVTNLFFLLVIAYCVLKCFFANIGRGGILLTQIAVGSMYLFSLPRGATEGFCSWCKQVIALCLTTFLQMTLLYLGLLTLSEQLLLGLGVLIAANEVPRVADRFGMETGMRTSIGNLVHHAQTAVRTVRAIAA